MMIFLNYAILCLVSGFVILFLFGGLIQHFEKSFEVWEWVVWFGAVYLLILLLKLIFTGQINI